MKFNKTIFLICFILILLFPNDSKAGCGGNYRCTTWERTGPYSGYCDDYSNIWARGCYETGSTEDTCGGGYLAPCSTNCYSMNCTWTDDAPACTCSWSNSGSCYIGGGGLCIRNRTCSCSPTGCGSCSGNNYTECAATECCPAAQSCTTNCGANASVPNGSCGTTSCACVECGADISAWSATCGNRTRTCSEDCGTDNCSGVTLSECVECGPHGSIPACGPWTQTYDCGADVTGCKVCAPTISGFTPACGSQTRTCTDNDGTCSGTCVGVVTTNCQHCAPTIPAWGATWTTCDGAHKRSITRTCTENDGLCDLDDCDAYMADQTSTVVCPAGSTCTYNTATNVQTRVEDCVGTITGTLFDASDLSSCPGDIGTNAVYSPFRIKNQGFSINGTWPVISIPVLTDANGNYSESVYASTSLGTYFYDYTALYNAGFAEGVKFECQSSVATVTTQGLIVTKDTGFWRVYGGWWQAVGGSVYAKGGVKSYVPASVTATDQNLILGDANGRVGVLAHGTAWTGQELGTNPGVSVSTRLWRIESLYEGLRYDYNYYTTRMSIFDSTPWNGGTITYDDGGKGYQILKHTGDVNLGPLTLSGTQKIILLIDGNVSAVGDIIVPDGAFLAVIAKGNIIFESNLTTAQGWFVAENINVPCHDGNNDGECDTDDKQLEGQGSFVGWSNISLDRNMNTDNNDSPSEKFVYRPDFVLNAPTPIKMYTREFAPFIP